MKVKALTDCNGEGYEGLNAGEVREVSEETAELLVSFGYVEAVEEPKEPEKEPATDEVMGTAEEQAEPKPKKKKQEEADEAKTEA